MGEAGSPDRPLAIVLHDLSGGGTERIALRLAHAWRALGQQVVILCGDPAGPLQAMTPGLELRSPPRPLRRAPGSRHELARWVSAEADRQGFGGLFLPGNYHFALLDELRFSPDRNPVVIAKLSNTVARQRQFDRLRPFWRERMARRLRRADAVVAMSPALAAEASALLGPLPLAVVPEPIVDDAAVPPSADLPRTGLLAAGRFAPQKNFALLLAAMALLEDRDTGLTIAGDGEERETLRRAACVTLGDRVVFPGRVADLAPLFRSARLFVLSSRFEGYPAVLIEALAAGCRLVATDCSPAIREIVATADIGEIVPRDDPRALAAAIDRQLGFAPPPTAAMASAIAEHRIGRTAAMYLDLFNRR